MLYNQEDFDPRRKKKRFTEDFYLRSSECRPAVFDPPYSTHPYIWDKEKKRRKEKQIIFSHISVASFSVIHQYDQFRT